ncbi:hypothetical protein Dimus_016226, partial [Dionaea muscipula]
MTTCSLGLGDSSGDGARRLQAIDPSEQRSQGSFSRPVPSFKPSKLPRLVISVSFLSST